MSSGTHTRHGARGLPHQASTSGHGHSHERHITMHMPGFLQGCPPDAKGTGMYRGQTVAHPQLPTV